MNDCRIIYEKFKQSTNSCAADSTNDPCKPRQSVHHRPKCICKTKVSSEYPNYAAEEIALFCKLKSGWLANSTAIRTQDTEQNTNVSNRVDEKEIIIIDDEVVLNNHPEKRSLNIEDKVKVTNNKTPGHDSMDVEIIETVNLDSSKYSGIAKPGKVKGDINENKNEAQPQAEEKTRKDCDNSGEQLQATDQSANYYLSRTRIKKRVNYSEQSEDDIADFVIARKPEKPSLKCPICIKTSVVRSKCELQNHLLRHISQTNCDAVINRKSIMAMRKLNTQMSKNKQFKQLHVCGVCYKVFLRVCELDKHSRMHSDERPYQCNLCPKNYKRMSHLTRHQLQTHNSKK